MGFSATISSLLFQKRVSLSSFTRKGLDNRGKLLGLRSEAEGFGIGSGTGAGASSGSPREKLLLPVEAGLTTQTNSEIMRTFSWTLSAKILADFGT